MTKTNFNHPRPTRAQRNIPDDLRDALDALCDPSTGSGQAERDAEAAERGRDAFLREAAKLTRAAKREAKRARRNTPQAKARRLAARQRKQHDAVVRFEAMKANPFDIAWSA